MSQLDKQFGITFGKEFGDNEKQLLLLLNSFEGGGGVEAIENKKPNAIKHSAL